MTAGVCTYQHRIETCVATVRMRQQRRPCSRLCNATILPSDIVDLDRNVHEPIDAMSCGDMNHAHCVWVSHADNREHTGMLVPVLGDPKCDLLIVRMR
jgi:hypothetical protein